MIERDRSVYAGVFAALNLLLDVVAVHPEGVALPVLGAVDLDGLRYREHGQLPYTFAAHRFAVPRCLPRHLVPLAVPDVQVPLVDILLAHPDASVVYDDLAFLLIDIYSDSIRVSVPCVGNDLRQHGWHVAVKADTQVVEHVQIDSHL